MKKTRLTRKLGLVTRSHIVKCVIIFSSVFIAGFALAEGGSECPFKGTISGDYNGRVMEMSVSGSFTMTISADGTVSGKYTGYAHGTISGKVAGSGEINAKGSAEIATWTGTISMSDGRLSGKGSWEGFNGGGKWWSK